MKRGWIRHEDTDFDSIEALIALEAGEPVFKHADGVHSLSPYPTEPRPEETSIDPLMFMGTPVLAQRE